MVVGTISLDTAKSGQRRGQAIRGTPRDVAAGIAMRDRQSYGASFFVVEYDSIGVSAQVYRSRSGLSGRWCEITGGAWHSRRPQT